MKENIELRKALDDLIDLTAEQHLAAVMNLKGHEIRLHERCVVGNCLSRALMPSEWSHSGYAQIMRQFFASNNDVAADVAFLKWLDDKGHLVREDGGELALYYDDSDWEHAGVLQKDGKIISKWGPGWFIFCHGELELPLRYGKPRYFKKLDEQQALDLFAEYTIGLVGKEDFRRAFPGSSGQCYPEMSTRGQ